MKETTQVTACMVDNGLGIPLAQRLAPHFKRFLYFSEWERAFPVLNERIMGDGFEGIERVDQLWTLKKYVDVFIFPDIYRSGLQLELEHQGFKVWGSRNADELEIYRSLFLKILKSTGMQVPKYESVSGLTELRNYLANRENVFVKISKFRGCFDEQTEILTNSGWKFFKDLLPFDKVATGDIKTRNLEFRVPDAHIKYWHDGPMVKIESRGMSALVTPNHGLWSKSGLSMKEWKYRPAFELMDRGGATIIPRALNWTGPEWWSFDRFAARFTCDQWLSFLGWFVSEGSLSLVGPNHNKYRITISQSQTANKAKCKEIEDLLCEMGFNPQREGASGFSVYNKVVFLELAKTCYVESACSCGKRMCSHRKIVPDYVKRLCPRQIQIFLESYGKGDGSVDRGTQNYYTASKYLADDLQEIISKMGKSASIKSRFRKDAHIIGRKIQCDREQFTITALGTRDIVLLPNNFHTEQYSGYVYDVTVSPHHSIFVRRGGHTFWSGNSMETFHWRDWRHDEGWLDCMAVKLGPAQDHFPFLVFDAIETDLELGGDTFCIDGKFPDTMINGLECKDRGYLGAVTPRAEMPEAIKAILDAFGPILATHGMRNFWSMEARVKGENAYFIDPTPRLPCPAGGAQMDLIDNLPEVIWAGANGELVEPIWTAQFGAECVLTAKSDKQAWTVVDFPAEIRPHVKCPFSCEIDGRTCFPPLPALPGENPGDEIGFLVATGDTIPATISEMKRLVALLPDGIHASTESLFDLLKEAHSAEDEGHEFSDQNIPPPEIAVADT